MYVQLQIVWVFQYFSLREPTNEHIDWTILDRSVLDCSGLDRIILDRTAPNQTRLDNTVVNHSGLHCTRPDGPSCTVLGQILPDWTVVDHVGP